MNTIDLGLINMDLIAGPYGGLGANNSAGCGLIIFGNADDSVTLFIDYPNNGLPAPNNWYSVDCRVVDSQGAVTWYSTGNIHAGDGYINSILNLGPGNFLITTNSGQSYNFRAKNLKLNNATPILVSPGTGLSNSCAATSNLNSVYFDPVKNLLAAGFYVPAGQLGTQIYSTVYSVGKNGSLSVSVDGFTQYSCPDCAPPIPNLYDQTNVDNSGSTYYAIQSNGIYSAEVNGFPCAVGAISPQINPGQTQPNCDSPNGNFVTSRSNQYFQIPNTSPGSCALIDSVLPNFFGAFYPKNFSSNYLATIFGLDVTYIGEFTSTEQVFGFSNGAITPNYIWATGNAVSPITGNNTLGAVYRSSLPVQLQNGGAVSKQAYSVVNSVRPISLTGAYKS